MAVHRICMMQQRQTRDCCLYHVIIMITCLMNNLQRFLPLYSEIDNVETWTFPYVIICMKFTIDPGRLNTQYHPYFLF